MSRRTEREEKLAWLGRGRCLRIRLVGLYAEWQERMSRADYAGIPCGSSGGSGNGMERKLDALTETEEEIAAAEQELMQVEREIRSAIEDVPTPVFQTYLRMRFLGYQSERQIAETMGYSLEHIKGYIRRNAVDNVKLTPNNSC